MADHKHKLLASVLADMTKEDAEDQEKVKAVLTSKLKELLLKRKEDWSKKNNEDIQSKDIEAQSLQLKGQIDSQMDIIEKLRQQRKMIQDEIDILKKNIEVVNIIISHTDSRHEELELSMDSLKHLRDSTLERAFDMLTGSCTIDKSIRIDYFESEDEDFGSFDTTPKLDPHKMKLFSSLCQN